MGEAVALTYGSRSQQPGKIVVAVTGFNLRNEITPTVVGFTRVEGRLKWDNAILEPDMVEGLVAVGPGDLIGGIENAGVGLPSFPAEEIPGTYYFSIHRRDPTRATGSGELFLMRFRPREGVTQATTRMELMPILANAGGRTTPTPATFMTTLWMFPYIPGPRGNKIQNTYGATITIRPGN